MSSTYSSLKFELIGTGEQSGTWGVTTNTNIGTAIQEAIAGRGTATFSSDADLTLTLSDSNATQTARNFILNVVSGVSLTATRNLIVPTINKPYIVENNTTGGQSIVVKTSAGTGVTVPNGKKVLVYANSVNVVAGFDYIPGGLATTTITGTTISGTDGTFSGTLGVTGAATLSSTLGVTGIATFSAQPIMSTLTASKPVFSDGSKGLTSTGTVPVDQGGTGAITADAARVGLNVITSTTGSEKIPVGTTAQRDGSPVTGYFRFNTTLSKFEGYNGTIWGAVGGGATGGGNDEVFVENTMVVTTSYSLPSGKSASSVGPITINSGITVTIPGDSRWVVL